MTCFICHYDVFPDDVEKVRGEIVCAACYYKEACVSTQPSKTVIREIRAILDGLKATYAYEEFYALFN